MMICPTCEGVSLSELTWTAISAALISLSYGMASRIFFVRELPKLTLSASAPKKRIKWTTYKSMESILHGLVPGHSFFYGGFRPVILDVRSREALP